MCHARGLRLTGGAPLLVAVYGAYGACLHAQHRPEWLPLLRRGWVAPRRLRPLGPPAPRVFTARTRDHRWSRSLTSAAAASSARRGTTRVGSAASARPATRLPGGEPLFTAPSVNRRASALDLASAVRALHEWGYSRPARTAAVADSAGGLALGGLLNASPKLLGAAVRDRVER